MKNTALKSTYLCLCFLYSLFTVKAQPSATRTEDYRDLYLWLQTANPAGFAFNPANPFSIAETGYGFTGGERRTATEAESAHRFQAQTEAYRSLKKIQVHGRFGYVNSRQNNRQWQTMIQPEAHLIGFGDTVAGRQNLETYNICGGIALPLGKGWHIGAEADYYARTARKHTDPRNQNDQADLSLTPGLLYRRKNFGIGAHFNYRRIAEKINYSVFDGGSYDILTSYPLWFYVRGSLLNPVNNSRTYEEERFGGGLQLWGKGRKVEWLSEWRYTAGTETFHILEQEKSRGGETGRQELIWNGQLRIEADTRHTFRPAYHRLIHTGYDNLQNKPENSTSPSYNHYGKVKRSAITSDLLSLDYTLLSVRDSLSGYRKVKARIEWQREQTQFFVYPAVFTQTIRHIAFSARYTRQFRIRQHSVELTAGAMYRNGNGNLPELQAEDGYPLPEIKISQQTDLLIHDFQIKTAETLRYSAAIQYTRQLKGAYAIFARTTAGYLHGLSGTGPTAHRLDCQIAVGLLF